jgi:hypothetical protein
MGSSGSGCPCDAGDDKFNQHIAKAPGGQVEECRFVSHKLLNGQRMVHVHMHATSYARLRHSSGFERGRKHGPASTLNTTEAAISAREN